MSELLKSGLVGNIGDKHFKLIKEETVKKWDSIGLLEGLQGRQKDNIAQLFENQATHLINESTVADGSGSFETVVFPIIRRVFSKLLANEIVSVQAMNMPIGRLFFMVPKIQDRVENSGTFQHLKQFGYPNEKDTDPGKGYGNAKSLYDRFYESSTNDDMGLFDYSKGNYKVIEVEDGDKSIVHFDEKGVEKEDAGPKKIVRGQTDEGYDSVILKIKGFKSAGKGRMVGANGHEIDTEEFLASLVIKKDDKQVPFNVTTQKYGKGIVEYQTKGGKNLSKYRDICTEDGIIYLTVDLETYEPGAGFKGVTDAPQATDFKVSYRQYETLEFEDEIGEVSFEIESITVSVTERKLRAKWSPEMAQDVSAFHNIDAEAELTALLSEQVAAEIDREILRDLRKGAAWSTKWDYNEWKYGSNGQAFAGYTQKDWNQTLITKINQLSAQIHKTTLRGGANWIVVSSEVSAIFDDLQYFHVSNAGAEQDKYNMGIERIGTLSGRYQVYRDPYFPPGVVLVGHKGTSLLDAGYIYAPYVPLQLTPTLVDYQTFTNVKGISSRYAKKMVNNRYYGVVNVQGVQSFDLNTLR